MHPHTAARENRTSVSAGGHRADALPPRGGPVSLCLHLTLSSWGAPNLVVHQPLPLFPLYFSRVKPLTLSDFHVHFSLLAVDQNGDFRIWIPWAQAGGLGVCGSRARSCSVGAVRSAHCGKVVYENHDNRLTGRMGAPEQRALALWLGRPHPY